MNDHCQRETTQVKCTERYRPELEGLSVNCRCEQIDRIPNATLLEKSIKACEYRHGHATVQPTFNSCRYWIRLKWKESPGQFWCYRQPFDFAAESRDRGDIR